MALVVFRSKAAAEIYMFAETARRLLQIVGKDDAERGVIRADEVADAMNRLTAAVEQEKEQLQRHRQEWEQHDRAGNADSKQLAPITLGQRAFPLIEMLRAAQRRRVDVTWGI